MKNMRTPKPLTALDARLGAQFVRVNAALSAAMAPELEQGKEAAKVRKPADGFDGLRGQRARNAEKKNDMPDAYQSLLTGPARWLGALPLAGGSSHSGSPPAYPITGRTPKIPGGGADVFAQSIWRLDPARASEARMRDARSDAE
jgi:hypothetical protein